MTTTPMTQGRRADSARRRQRVQKAHPDEMHKRSPARRELSVPEGRNGRA
ncbi:hypothetical protein ACNPQM_41805 [Streptomyces sp. NPDC056231]